MTLHVEFLNINCILSLLKYSMMKLFDEITSKSAQKFCFLIKYN